MTFITNKPSSLVFLTGECRLHNCMFSTSTSIYYATCLDLMLKCYNWVILNLPIPVSTNSDSFRLSMKLCFNTILSKMRREKCHVWCGSCDEEATVCRGALLCALSAQSREYCCCISSVCLIHSYSLLGNRKNSLFFKLISNLLLR